MRGMRGSLKARHQHETMFMQSSIYVAQMRLERFSDYQQPGVRIRIAMIVDYFHVLDHERV